MFSSSKFGHFKLLHMQNNCNLELFQILAHHSYEFVVIVMFSCRFSLTTWERSLNPP